MFRFYRLFLLLLLLATASPRISFAEKGMAVDPTSCLGCHSEKISADRFGASPHGKNGCTSCHLEGVDLVQHMTASVKLQKVNCSRCHQKEFAEHAGSVHQNKGVGCADCHSEIHHVAGWKKDKRVVLQRCLTCHPDQKAVLTSVHGKAIFAGNKDAADCSDCHGLHAIGKVQSADTTAGRMFHTSACIKCHENEKLMEANKVNHSAVETYLESYHGKGYRLGFLEKAAGCSDCHSAHGVLSKEDPASTVHKANLAKTCATCHKGASDLFAQYYSHGSHSDRENYPILYWTFLAMTGLLVGTFGVFWIHTLLWMYRGFVENREKQQALIEGRVHHIPEAGNSTTASRSGTSSCTSRSSSASSASP